MSRPRRRPPIRSHPREPRTSQTLLRCRVEHRDLRRIQPQPHFGAPRAHRPLGGAQDEPPHIRLHVDVTCVPQILFGQNVADHGAVGRLVNVLTTNAQEGVSTRLDEGKVDVYLSRLGHERRLAGTAYHLA